MTPALGADPHRRPTDPALYADRPTVDLQLADPTHATLDTARRQSVVETVEAAARSVHGPLIAVGNDPSPYSTVVPTLVFEGVSVSGA